MKIASECRFGRRFLGVAVLAAACVSPAGAEPGPQTVAAKYRLLFSGFDVGKYEFQAKYDGKSYAIQSNADVSALLGAFKWKGALETKGAVEAATLRPANYALNMKANGKDARIAVAFDRSGVKTYSVEPKKPVPPEAVPLKSEHLKSVFDPLSAIVVMTHANAASLCHQTVPIFDGKARYNLVFSPKGEQRLKPKSPKGEVVTLTVCSVKYVPVAGHKPRDFNKPWIDYNGIEIAFRWVPGAEFYVPHRVSIPTSIGAASMQAERVDITAANKEDIALTQ